MSQHQNPQTSLTNVALISSNTQITYDRPTSYISSSFSEAIFGQTLIQTERWLHENDKIQRHEIRVSFMKITFYTYCFDSN